METMVLPSFMEAQPEGLRPASTRWLRQEMFKPTLYGCGVYKNFGALFQSPVRIVVYWSLCFGSLFMETLRSTQYRPYIDTLHLYFCYQI